MAADCGLAGVTTPPNQSLRVAATPAFDFMPATFDIAFKYLSTSASTISAKETASADSAALSLANGNAYDDARVIAAVDLLHPAEVADVSIPTPHTEVAAAAASPPESTAATVSQEQIAVAVASLITLVGVCFLLIVRRWKHAQRLSKSASAAISHAELTAAESAVSSGLDRVASSLCLQASSSTASSDALPHKHVSTSGVRSSSSSNRSNLFVHRPRDTITVNNAPVFSVLIALPSATAPASSVPLKTSSAMNRAEASTMHVHSGDAAATSAPRQALTSATAGSEQQRVQMSSSEAVAGSSTAQGDDNPCGVEPERVVGTAADTDESTPSEEEAFDELEQQQQQQQPISGIDFHYQLLHEQSKQSSARLSRPVVSSPLEHAGKAATAPAVLLVTPNTNAWHCSDNPLWSRKYAPLQAATTTPTSAVGVKWTPADSDDDEDLCMDESMDYTLHRMRTSNWQSVVQASSALGEPRQRRWNKAVRVALPPPPRSSSGARLYSHLTPYFTAQLWSAASSLNDAYAHVVPFPPRVPQPAPPETPHPSEEKQQQHQQATQSHTTTSLLTQRGTAAMHKDSHSSSSRRVVSGAPAADADGNPIVPRAQEIRRRLFENGAPSTSRSSIGSSLSVSEKKTNHPATAAAASTVMKHGAPATDGFYTPLSGGLPALPSAASLMSSLFQGTASSPSAMLARAKTARAHLRPADSNGADRPPVAASEGGSSNSQEVSAALAATAVALGATVSTAVSSTDADAAADEPQPLSVSHAAAVAAFETLTASAGGVLRHPSLLGTPADLIIKFARMLKMGIPAAAVKHKAAADGVGASVIDVIVDHRGAILALSATTVVPADAAPTAVPSSGTSHYDAVAAVASIIAKRSDAVTSHSAPLIEVSASSSSSLRSSTPSAAVTVKRGDSAVERLQQRFLAHTGMAQAPSSPPTSPATSTLVRGRVAALSSLSSPGGSQLSPTPGMPLRPKRVSLLEANRSHMLGIIAQRYFKSVSPAVVESCLRTLSPTVTIISTAAAGANTGTQLTAERITSAAVVSLSPDQVSALKDKLMPSSEEAKKYASFTGDMDMLTEVDSLLAAVARVPAAASRIAIVHLRSSLQGRLDELNGRIRALSSASTELKSSVMVQGLLASVPTITGSLLGGDHSSGCGSSPTSPPRSSAAAAESSKMSLLTLTALKGISGAVRGQTLLQYVVEHLSDGDLAPFTSTKGTILPLVGAATRAELQALPSDVRSFVAEVSRLRNTATELLRNDDSAASAESSASCESFFTGATHWAAALETSFESAAAAFAECMAAYGEDIAAASLAPATVLPVIHDFFLSFQRVVSETRTKKASGLKFKQIGSK